LQRAESTAAAGRVVRREQIGIVVGVWVGIGVGIGMAVVAKGQAEKNAAAAAVGHSSVDHTVGVAVTRNYYWGWIGGLQQC